MLGGSAPAVVVVAPLLISSPRLVFPSLPGWWVCVLRRCCDCEEEAGMNDRSIESMLAAAGMNDRLMCAVCCVLCAAAASGKY